MTNSTAKSVIKAEIRGLEFLLNSLDDKFENAINAILECTGKVIIMGVGKPGHVGKKISATFASLGTPSFFVHAGEAAHGDLGMITSYDVCIIMSFSGNTAETVNVVPQIKQIGAKTVAVTGNPDSGLAQSCDIHVDIGVREEADLMNLAPTASSTAFLALGDALAVTVAEKKGYTRSDFAKVHPGGSLGKQFENEL